MTERSKGTRPAPLSVRLSREERARLEAAAGGQPLGAYIKGVLFAGDAPRRRASPRPPVADSRLLAQLLGRLGASRIASNLNQFAHAASMGGLDCDDDVKATLAAACADLKMMRVMLVAALGLKGATPFPRAAPPRRAFTLATNGKAAS